MALLGIDHIQLAAPPGAESAARHFFGELLGLTEIPKPDGVAASGGAWFKLQNGQELHVGIQDPGFAPAQKAHPCLIADDLNELATTLASAGHEPRWDTRIADAKRFFVDDPWGNRLEFRGRGRTRRTT